MNRLLGFLIIYALMTGTTQAHSGNPKYHVIIDTDGAVDDMRAIAMLLSGNDIRVLAITCSQGTLVPDTVYNKVRSLLFAFHHEGIPVGIASKTGSPMPPWGSFARKINWGSGEPSSDLNRCGKTTDILNGAMENYQSKITLIALGSLKTYADWLKENRDYIGKIERIIWYNDHRVSDGFNYRVSPESYEFIRELGILMDIVSSDTDPLLINPDYLDHLNGINSVYAKRILDVLSQPPVKEMIHLNHLQIWDDLVPIFLTVPVLFETEREQEIRFVKMSPNIPPGFIYESIGKLLISASATNNKVFMDFPTDTSLYKPAYSNILKETLDQFGPVEWKAICLTNEIHGHTGIYSIIGAKMGIRAMEYFNVGVNNLAVTTYAGNSPPLSCFNDGVQISTGATIGQGLITVSDSISDIPSAIFGFNNLQVHISLKPEMAIQMKKDIEFGVNNFGLLSDRYWKYIEECAIRYWSEYDRHKIFLVKIL